MDKNIDKIKEALFYEKVDTKKQIVQCQLCPHECIIGEGKTGLCKARKNFNGKLIALTYNKFTSAGMDPIEKKPLYHFYPGSQIFSVGTIGCNFRCSFCQNWEISQADINGAALSEITPESALNTAKKYNSLGIAYTYNEPLINFEWVKETSALFRKNNLKNVLVTNGYINKEPLADLIENIDAANIDIKFINEEPYRRICGGKLENVLDTIKAFADKKVHFELTNLVIPGENDKKEQLERLVKWVASVDPGIPMHFSRYFPQYKMNQPPTEMETLENAYKIGAKYLKYVYIGNINDYNYANTFCKKCGTSLIKRQGYAVKIENLTKNKCSKCGEKANIITQ